MKYLIDTHILIWLAVSPEKVPEKAFEIIENPMNDISISTVSLWEIAIKIAIKKLDLQGLEIDDLVQICDEQNIKIVQLPVSAVKQYCAIPMIFSVLVSSLYNIVDSIFVGRLGGASFCVGAGKTTLHFLTFFFPSCYP